MYTSQYMYASMKQNCISHIFHQHSQKIGFSYKPYTHTPLERQMTTATNMKCISLHHATTLNPTLYYIQRSRKAIKCDAKFHKRTHIPAIKKSDDEL